jgi:sulfate adenylyltransferase subunit 2
MVAFWGSQLRGFEITSYIMKIDVFYQYATLHGAERSSMMAEYTRSHLEFLESESIFILREVVAQFERPVLLFSGGKDSILLAHLSRRAFHPAKIPYPLLHIDTGHNFPETLVFRDRLAGELGVELLVRYVQDSIDSGRVAEERGPTPSRNALQTVTLLDAIAELRIDAAIGGARRDEEKARAKERIFSHRDSFGQWNPKNQRPELWSLFNGHKAPGEHFRVFPLSNWTEMDIWQYAQRFDIELPSLYFAHRRDVFLRGGTLFAASECMPLLPGEERTTSMVRFRTIGDMTCTGAVESRASSMQEVIRELAMSRTTERGTRADDRRSETFMEDRKRQGYF